MKKSKNTELQNEEKPTVKPKSEALRGFEDKVKFALWVFPETMSEVEHFTKTDNCRSKSEFIEKAINFYTGYLSTQRNVNFLSPKITEAMDSVVHGSEQRISRNLFKIAVELGKISHMIAAENEIDAQTMRELHSLCVDEVRKINGTISFESAVEFQNE